MSDCALVDAYIDYYNSEQRQWKLEKVTPVQYKDAEKFARSSSIIKRKGDWFD